MPTPQKPRSPCKHAQQCCIRPLAVRVTAASIPWTTAAARGRIPWGQSTRWAADTSIHRCRWVQGARHCVPGLELDAGAAALQEAGVQDGVQSARGGDIQRQERQGAELRRAGHQQHERRRRQRQHRAVAPGAPPCGHGCKRWTSIGRRGGQPVDQEHGRRLSGAAHGCNDQYEADKYSDVATSQSGAHPPAAQLAAGGPRAAVCHSGQADARVVSIPLRTVHS